MGKPLRRKRGTFLDQYKPVRVMDHGYTMGKLLAWPLELVRPGFPSVFIVSRPDTGSSDKKIRVTEQDKRRQIHQITVFPDCYKAEEQEFEQIANLEHATNADISRMLELSDILRRPWERNHLRSYIVFPNPPHQDIRILDTTLHPYIFKMQLAGITTVEYDNLRKVILKM